LDIHKLLLFANIAGFKIVKLHPVKANLTSVFLGVFLIPVIAVFNIYAYILNVRKNQHIEKTVKKQQYQKIVQLNLHPNILFGGHLFVEFTKILDIKKHQPSVYKKESEIY
jgi:hypothetical protein